MTEPRKIVCHAPGERCLGCDHYQGKSDMCKYADPEPTEPRKTPRTKRQWQYYVANDMHDAGEEFAERLEIETQELAKALEEILSHRVREYESNHLLRFSSIVCEIADKALTRHRAKQEGSE